MLLFTIGYFQYARHFPLSAIPPSPPSSSMKCSTGLNDSSKVEPICYHYMLGGSGITFMLSPESPISIDKHVQASLNTLKFLALFLYLFQPSAEKT